MLKFNILATRLAAEIKSFFFPLNYFFAAKIYFIDIKIVFKNLRFGKINLK